MKFTLVLLICELDVVARDPWQAAFSMVKWRYFLLKQPDLVTGVKHFEAKHEANNEKPPETLREYVP
ncbi:hypothetical protein ACF2JD_08910 [Aeromonas sp. A-5]|uniref:hypothetical protein n=1 Tax=Aeromonas ichthyocola TaxID=3367746 RepID=UPI0038F25DB3